MKAGFKITRIEFFKKPNFIEVRNYHYLNEIGNANYNKRNEIKNDSSYIGVWKIKYKNN